MKTRANWMKIVTLACLCFLADHAGAAIAELKVPQQQNTLRPGGLPPVSNPELPAHPGQFASVGVSAGGGRMTPSSGSGLRLSVSFGRIFSSGSPDYLFGEVIEPPKTDLDGNLLAADSNYWRSEPIRQSETVRVAGEPPVIPAERFYYSPHSDKVYASHTGAVTVFWRTREPIDGFDFGVLEETYQVTRATSLPVRRIFWTEGRFTGPAVSIPEGVIQDLVIRYNNLLPAIVPEDEVVIPPLLDAEGNPVVVVNQTLWFDERQSMLRAINREGRVMIEFLGQTRGGPGSGIRESLGIEVVDVIQESLPRQVETYLGDQILPSPNGGETDPAHEELTPVQVNEFALGVKYVEKHLIDERTVPYAVRENLEPLRVQFYWLERGGIKDIRWPVYLNSYRIVWPEDTGSEYISFVRPDDANLSNDSWAPLPAENNPHLVYQDGKEASLDFQRRLQVDLNGDADEMNRSLIRFSSATAFWYMRVMAKPQPTPTPRDGVVAKRLAPPEGTGDLSIGYIDQAHGTAFNVNTYLNPFEQGLEKAAQEGAIIPVNNTDGNGSDRLRVWWFQEVRPPAEVADHFEPVYVPAVVEEFTLTNPSPDKKIVLASGKGSGELPLGQNTGFIYYQNDPSKPGYNPNEEHAVMRTGTIYATADHLNIATSYKPYVLLQFVDPLDGRPNMEAFEVVRDSEEHKFRYEAEAGKRLQAPAPLSFTEFQPLLENGSSRNEEVAGDSTEADLPGSLVEDKPHYKSFLFEDRKSEKWVYRGPHNPGAIGTIGPDGEEILPPTFGIQYYYRVQEGFAFPGEANPPEVGTIIPYLTADDNRLEGTPLTVIYEPKWPELTPELQFAETLTLPKHGLPQIRGQQSLQVVYEQSLTKTSMRNSVVLHDPTRRKKYAFVKNSSNTMLDSLPDTIAQTTSRGKTYFQNLPAHLQERLFVDPNEDQFGALVFEGKFVEEVTGEDYLLPNVLTEDDLKTVKELCAAGDEHKAAWDYVVTNLLTTTVERFVENPDVPGTYIPDPDGGFKTFKSGETVELTSPPARPQKPESDANLGFFDEAVESYALTAVGGGEGYVVLFGGNGEAFTTPEEPVQAHVLRVGGGFHDGELKPLVAANPLSENVTVLHTGDFASKPEKYEFEWQKSPPDSTGLPPQPYQFFYHELTPAVTVGDQPQQLPATLNPHDLTLNANIDLGDVNTETRKPFVVYLGISAGEDDGFMVKVNGEGLFSFQFPEQESEIPFEPDSDNLPRSVQDIMTRDQRVTHVFPVEASRFRLAGEETISIDFTSPTAPDDTSTIDLRIAVKLEEDVSGSKYSALTTAGGPGKNRYLVSGSGVDTLGDNYYIMRYRPLGGHVLNPDGQEEIWSRWTRPKLVEGWIKRVLSGINPFHQRVTDFFESAVDTDVSLLTQAGTRSEGDIALTLDNVQNQGLISIYETVLNRGVDLSIGGNPKVDYGPANDALLLVTGYLADLYTALGNEAFADAADPTIHFDSQAVGTIVHEGSPVDFESTFRTTSTSRFSFHGQVPSLLEEELTLLRGRDDFLSPGVEVRPVYNRLYWNYTRGIDAGEVIYALNYNIVEKDDANADGKIDARDAQHFYPQGHGDAYGHYLTALLYYYRLLSNDHFTWGIRAETVNILGQPVSVDYHDERRFASAAAALAKTAKRIQSLEHRKSLLESPKAGWKHLQPEAETNEFTGRTRTWGFDDWSSRGTQGAFYHWVVANAILPANDTKNEGILKIDRTTVPELEELARSAEFFQQNVDAANSGLNPLGLSKDSLVFDISPGGLESDETHFEQVYDRAVRALRNAVSVFDRATDSTRLLRSMENQNQNVDAAIADQERAFTIQLSDIYGAPYPGDIGPGKTYPQGYDGPDLLRPFYISRPFDVFTKDTLFAYDETDSKEFQLLVPDPEFIHDHLEKPYDFIGIGNDAANSRSVTYTLDEARGPYQFATTAMGRRPFLGTIQNALGEVRLAEEQLYAGLAGMDLAKRTFLRQLEDFERDMINRSAIKAAQLKFDEEKKVLDKAIAAAQTLKNNFIRVANAALETADAVAEAYPIVNGLDNDVTSTIRGVTIASGIAVKATSEIVVAGAEQAEASAELAFALKDLATKYVVLGLEEDSFFRAQAVDLKSKYAEARSALREVDALQIAYVRALEKYRTEVANGGTILAQRETYRKRAAGILQGYRTRDVAFRSFRNEALEQYETLFDLAAKYGYLAAQAYDYETGLLNSPEGRKFIGGFSASRALGLLDSSQNPTFAASETGDPGLAGLLAKLKSDWDVVEGRLGFNNPDRYGTVFSLRQEFFRIPDNDAGDRQWKEQLAKLVIPNLLADSDVATHALQIDSEAGTPVSGIVLAFPTEITTGRNFFGKPLAAGDHRFTESNFATKIHAAGVVFDDYKGMDPCLVCTANGPGPDTSSHPDALAASPHVYLLPTGADVMRTPPIGDGQTHRNWRVRDHALPLPFDIGQIGAGAEGGSLASDSLNGSLFATRKFQAFRAVGTEEFFVSPLADNYTNARLVGRSVENTQWKLVIPASELLDDSDEGLRRFINSVSDIKIYFQSYSFSGN